MLRFRKRPKKVQTAATEGQILRENLPTSCFCDAGRVPYSMAAPSWSVFFSFSCDHPAALIPNGPACSLQMDLSPRGTPIMNPL